MTEGPRKTGTDTGDESYAASGWRNLPAKPPEQSSAGVCGMHGCFIGPACPKCVTQAQVIYPGTSVIAPGLSMQVPL